jgi:hypothetical protein
MSATLFIGAMGLTVNIALAMLALRMVMRLDRPLPGLESVDEPAVMAEAATMDQPASLSPAAS